MLKKKNFLVLLLPLVFLLSGCSISFGGGGGTQSDAGVFISTDQGSDWSHRALIPSISGEPASIARTPVQDLAMDPSDSRAIYMGSVAKGLFYTYDISKGWNQVEELPKKTVDAVAVDPKSKCTIYASLGNRVFKSVDCNRTWSPVYYDNDSKTRINSIAVDHYNNQTVYIGTTRGDVIKSRDGGGSWRTVHRADSSVKEVVISPHDSRIIFISTEKDGVARSEDGGGNWVNFEERLKEFRDSDRVRDLNVCDVQSGLVFVATSYGMLKSENNGESWEKINLITSEKEAVINAIALGPKNCEHIYYVTNTTFYRSLDGGENWATVELPGSRKGADLLIDFENPNILYLGMGLEPKESKY